MTAGNKLREVKNRRETNQEAISVTEAREDEGLYQSRSSGSGKKWLDSGHISSHLFRKYCLYCSWGSQGKNAEVIDWPFPAPVDHVLSELSTMTGEGNGNPLQYSCLENPMDRGAWQATVHRVATSQTGLK